MFGKLFWAVSIACAIWVIYDVWTNNKKLNETGKFVWTVFALLFSMFTAFVYYFRYKSKD